MLLDLAQDAIDERWRYYEQLSSVERRIPSVHHDGVETAVEISQQPATSDDREDQR